MSRYLDSWMRNRYLLFKCHSPIDGYTNRSFSVKTSKVFYTCLGSESMWLPQIYLHWVRISSFPQLTIERAHSLKYWLRLRILNEQRHKWKWKRSRSHGIAFELCTAHADKRELVMHVPYTKWWWHKIYALINDARHCCSAATEMRACVLTLAHDMGERPSTCELAQKNRINYSIYFWLAWKLIVFARFHAFAFDSNSAYRIEAVRRFAPHWKLAKKIDFSSISC